MAEPKTPKEVAPGKSLLGFERESDNANISALEKRARALIAQLEQAVIEVEKRIRATGIYTGAGLQGGGNLTQSRTLSIKNLGVITAMIADTAVTKIKVAAAAISPDKLDSSGTASDAKVLSANSGGTQFAWIDIPEGDVKIDRVTFLASGSAITWAAMPAAGSEFQGTAYTRHQIDLSSYGTARFHVYVSTAGAAGSVLGIAYSDDSGSTWHWVSADGPTAGIGSTGYKVTGWKEIVAGAKADVLIAAYGADGDGSASPAVYRMVAEFRKSTAETSTGGEEVPPDIELP